MKGRVVVNQVLVFLLISIHPPAWAYDPPKGLFDKMNYVMLYRRTIPSPTKDASGIAYSPKTHTLFVVDDHAVLLELTLDGKLLRTIPLEGFDDTEGIAYVSGYTLAVIEEERGTLVLFKVKPNTTSISRTDCDIYSIETDTGNIGLVGVAYSPKEKMFYVAKELSPLKILSVKILGDKAVHFKPLDASLLPLKDLGDVALAPALTDNFLLISTLSRKLMEVNANGEAVSSYDLSAYGAFYTIQGVTFDEDNLMYVVTEGKKNNLICFIKTSN